MPADIYTKVFANDKAWSRVQRFINVSPCKSVSSEFLSAWVRERNEIGRAPEVTRAREIIVSKAGKRRVMNEKSAAAISKQNCIKLVCCWYSPALTALL